MFENFKKTITEELNSFNELGYSKAAKELGEESEQEFNCSKVPQFFTGDLEADLVMVNLNPKDEPTGYEKFKDWHEYYEFHSSFGDKHYRKNRNYNSNFDNNQLYFYEGFGGIELLGDKERADKEATRENLARVQDNKLQLELIPYASHTFNWKALEKEYLNRQMHRLLDVITEKERKYVLFCGKDFVELLEPYRIDKNQEGNVHMKQFIKRETGELTNNYTYHNILLKYKNTVVRAGIAQSYAGQFLNGYLKREYGAFCRECWDLYMNEF